MKKSDWIFTSSVLFYSMLFWKQMPGLNFFIFTVFLLAGQILMDRKLMHNRNWIFSAIGAVCSSFCVLYYGTTLSIFATFFSLLMTSYFASVENGSVLVGFASSMLSVCASIGYMVSQLVERRMKKSEGEASGKFAKRFAIVMIALVVVLIFVFMYRESSVMFYNLTEKINLDFISLPWMVFTFIGALLVYGFYFHNSIPSMGKWDAQQPLQLSPDKKETWLDKLMSMDSEQFSGVVLLSLLNVLLLIVNGLDAAFIFGGNGNLPQGITYTQYVHQGVGMLITSIIFAMLIILYYFRGRMNFSANGKWLKNLAMIWIVQNAFMLFSTFWRNDVYILMYGLTYKRIGVFVYLLLTLIGLGVTAWKVQKKKTNAFLIRTNSWLFYSVWIIAGFWNWDAIVLNFNENHVPKANLIYVNSLSENILPELLNLTQKHPDVAEEGNVSVSLPARIYVFLNKQKYLRDEMKWPSYQFKAASVYETLRNENNIDTLGFLNVSRREIKQIYFFPGFSNITELDVSSNELKSLGEIGKFKKLTYINLDWNNELKSLEGIEQLENLERIDLSGTAVKDFSPLLKLKKLKTLKVDGLSSEWVDKIQSINPEIKFIYNYE